MKQREGSGAETIELHLDDVQRGRGRPSKADALTPAQRAKRYRAKQKALRTGADGTLHCDGKNIVTDITVADLQVRLINLQMKYDLEHLNTTALNAELETLRQAARKPAANPLALQLASLKKKVADQESVINVFKAEINKLRDEFGTSRKKR